MRAATVAAVVSSAALAYAQQTIDIQVGAAATDAGGMFQFVPFNVTAQSGDTIRFTFKGVPGNHSVTQSTIEHPCTQMDGGFDSGFVFVPPMTSANASFPTWNLTITDATQPIYFFCEQPTLMHCAAQGMVGTINAPTTGNASWDAMFAAAIALNGTTPSPPTPALSGSGAAATAAPGPITGSFQGFGLPTGAAGNASGSGASGSGSGSGSPTSGAPAPTGSGAGGSGGSNGAMSNAASGLLAVAALVFGVTLL